MTERKNKEYLHRPAKPLSYDPLGSYTGTPMDPEEIPVQDADDL